MHNIMQLLIDHGYVVLFVAVLAEQFGLPVPATPFLVAAGALAGLERLNLAWSLAIATGASLGSDDGLFRLGKRQGNFILHWLGRKSQEPQSCAIKVESTYAHYGPRAILVSKFLPIFNILAPQLAGTFHLARWKFFALDSTAAFLWASAYMAVGWVFRSQLELLVPFLERLGAVLGFAVVVTVAAFFLRRIAGANAQHVVAK